MCIITKLQQYMNGCESGIKHKPIIVNDVALTVWQVERLLEFHKYLPQHANEKFAKKSVKQMIALTKALWIWPNKDGD